MPNQRRRIALMVLATIALTAVALMPVAVYLGHPFWLPAEIIAIGLLIAFFALGAVMVAYLAFVMIALFGMGLCAIVWTWIIARRDARKLKALLPASRKTSWSDLTSISASSPGTIIIEARTIGWNTANIWWTPSDVTADAAAVGISTSEQQSAPEGYLSPDPITPFCIEQYLNPRAGNALLVQIHINPWSDCGLRHQIERFHAEHPATKVQYICLPLHEMALHEPPPATAKHAG